LDVEGKRFEAAQRGKAKWTRQTGKSRGIGKKMLF